GDNRSRTESDGFAMSHEVSFQRSFRKRGRSIYTTANVNVNNSNNERISHVVNEFFRTNTSSVLDQLRSQEQSNTTGRLYINYNEPLMDRFSLRFTQSLDWS